MFTPPRHRRFGESLEGCNRLQEQMIPGIIPLDYGKVCAAELFRKNQGPSRRGDSSGLAPRVGSARDSEPGAASSFLWCRSTIRAEESWMVVAVAAKAPLSLLQAPGIPGR